MRYFLILCGLCLVASVDSTPAHANGQDAKFANGLVERGYFDLAEVEFKRMMDKSGASDTEKRAGKLGLARVMMSAALREPNVKSALIKYGAAEEEFRSFIQDREDPQYFLAAFQLGQLLQSKSSTIAQVIEDDLISRAGFESKEEIREVAVNSLNDAQTLFDDLVVYLQSQTSLTPAQQIDLERSLYFQATNYFFVGQLYDKGTFEREANFKKATTKLEDYIWEYESRPSALYALLYKGKAHFEISLENDSEGDLNEALDSFSGAEVIGEKPDSLSLLQNLYEWAIYEAAVALSAWQKHIQAIEKIDSMIAAFETNGPSLRLGQHGFLAILEKSRALQNLGDIDLALDTANTVAERAKGTSAGRKANDLIKELLGRGSGTDGLSPKVLMAGGEAFYASRDYLQASHKYREAILAYETQEEGSATKDQEVAAQAWNRLGDCLKRIGRPLQSGLAFKAGRDRFKEPFETYKDSAFRAYSSFQAHAKRLSAKDPSVERLTNEAKDFILRTFTDDVGDIIYFEGKDDFDEGSFTEAKEKFFRVDVKTRHYETAQLYIGRCDLEEGFKLIVDEDVSPSPTARNRVETGLKTLADYREWTNEYPATDPARIAARDQALAASDYYESEAYWKLREWDKMLKVLEGFQTKWAEQSNLIPPAIYNQLRAYIRKGDLSKAAERADFLYENYKKSGSTIQALAMIGQSYSDQEKAAENSGDEASAEKNRKLSADFLYKWLQATGAGFKQSITVGLKFYELQDYSLAIKIFSDTFNRYKNNSKVKGTKDLFQLKLVLARCYLATQKFHEAEPLFEEMMKERGQTKDLLIGAAKCYGGWIEEKDGKLVEFDGTARYPDALEIYSRFAGTQEPGSDLWWMGRFGQIYMLFKAGQAEGNDKYIKNAREVHRKLKITQSPPFGPEDIHKRFMWLDKELAR